MKENLSDIFIRIAGTGQRREASEKKRWKLPTIFSMLVITLEYSTIDTKMSYLEANWGSGQEMFSRPHHIVLAKEAAAQGILLFGC